MQGSERVLFYYVYLGHPIVCKFKESQGVQQSTQLTHFTTCWLRVTAKLKKNYQVKLNITKKVTIEIILARLYLYVECHIQCLVASSKARSHVPIFLASYIQY
jgi:hypothetical protein